MKIIERLTDEELTAIKLAVEEELQKRNASRIAEPAKPVIAEPAKPLIAEPAEPAKPVIELEDLPF